MGSRNTVPDAWDDDWTNVADTKTPQPNQKLTKAEKRIQHQQLQKDLWASAEDPSRNLWLESKGAVPLKQDFVPTMTVLSRRPQIATKKDAVSNGADEDDSETEARKKRESELEERQRKAKLEREEKVRKYAEARERIMGASAPASPKIKADSRESSQGRSDGRKNRGSNMNSQSGSSRQSPARSVPNNHGQLFDPEDMSRRVLSRKDSPAINGPRSDEPIRQPRGPDSSGRGFAARSGGQAAT